MKKPKDIAELATRLASAASTPLVAPPEIREPVVIQEPATVKQTTEPRPAESPARASAAKRPRKSPNRQSVSVFLRLSQSLYEQYDQEAVRRTKQTGRGVTVQQVILDRLGEARA